MDSTYTMSLKDAGGELAEGPWIRSRSWDLMMISFSALLVAIPIVTYYTANSFTGPINSLLSALGISFTWDADASRNLVNGMIALLIGGPHMYATYTRTALDTRFSRKHKTLLVLSLLIPMGVIYFGITQFRFLITFFFFWASIHIVHQAAFIVECYNRRSDRMPPVISRLIDFSLLASALYPVATWKFIHNKFSIGSIEIFFPDFLKFDGIFYLIVGVFAASLALFIWKTMNEIRQGTVNYPKILFISLTALVAFFIPAFDNLDVAFQGFNAWHSFQYLGLTWYINRLRHERGEIGTGFIDRISESRRPWKFYLFNVGLTAAAVALVTVLIALKPVFGLSFDQCYYMVVLSFLLTHYLHDHFLFTKPEEILLTSA
jgi:hypothetical protein